VNRHPSELRKAVAARDAAFRRVGRLTALCLTASAAGTAVVAGVAATTTHFRTAVMTKRSALVRRMVRYSTVTTLVTAPVPKLVPVAGGGAAISAAASQARAQPVQTPSVAVAPPVVVSGGS